MDASTVVLLLVQAKDTLGHLPLGIFRFRWLFRGRTGLGHERVSRLMPYAVRFGRRFSMFAMIHDNLLDSFWVLVQ